MPGPKYPRLERIPGFSKGIRSGKIDPNQRWGLQPKYDGSIIALTKESGKIVGWTKKGGDISGTIFEDAVVKSGLMDKMSNVPPKYVVFAEVGGTADRSMHPAGYRDCWDSEYDYRVLDVFDKEEERWLTPNEVKEFAEKYDMKHVETVETVAAADLASNWKKLLAEKFSKYEGFVAYPIEAEYSPSKKVKFKHELAEKYPDDLISGKQVEEKVLSEDEIRNEIMRVINEFNLTIGDVKGDRKTAKKVVSEVRKRLEEEARERGVSPPTKKQIFAVLYKM